MINQILGALLLLIIAVLATLYYRTRTRLIRYQGLYDDTLGPVLRVDLDTFRPISCSPSFASLLEYASPGECIELFSEYSHLRGHGFEYLYRLIRDTRQRTLTIELVNRSGQLVAGEAEAFVADTGDFFELRLLPGESARGRDPGPANVRQGLLPCIELDPQLTILSCNLAARNLFGWGGALIAGRKLADLVFPEKIRDRLESIYSRRIEKKGGVRLRHLTVVSGNELAECRWQVVSEPDVQRVYAFCLDSYNQELPAPLMDKLFGDTYFVWELDLSTLEIVADASWLKLFGYDNVPEVSRPKFWESIVYPEDEVSVRQALARFANGEEKQFFARYRIASGSGVEHWMESRAVAKTFDKDGNPRRVIGVSRDITEEVGQKDAQWVANRHDIANHLAAMTGYASLLAKGQAPLDSVESYAREIVDAGRRARDLLQGKQAPAGVDDGLIGQVEAIGQKYGIHTVHNDPEAELKTGVADLAGILEPLCLNALESGSAARQIHLQTGKIQAGMDRVCSECGTSIDGDFCFVRIRDAGEGIAPDHLPWVLAAGFSTRGIHVERGRGLATANERIHDIGGHIALRSTEGEGTVVTVYLPIQGRQGASREEPRGGGHVLVIDDQVSVARYLEEVIGREGYDVTAITDARDALSTFHENPARFDLVVTDWTMPGVSGDAVIEAMLEVKPKLPVIICTGYSESMSEPAARKLGARGYVRKPVDETKLLGLINESLRP